jgi:8-oxo-dGTP pyrophosphatase MutT (NUDIX family)
MESSKAIAPAIPAATVVILRDRPDGIEVFMVVRHHAIDFASGAIVFPGGKVDPGDSDPAWVDLAPIDGSAAERRNIVAAARETFEEAGLVLARRRGTQSMIDAHEAHGLAERHRATILAGKTQFRELIAGEGLQLATDLMVPFAHWITPEPLPKRFDTFFYLVAAPVDQLGMHDGRESVEGLWISPQQALREAEAGSRTLVFATQLNLVKLARYRTVAEAVQASRATPIVTVLPILERGKTSHTFHIPEAAGYGVSQVTIPKPLGGKKPS